MAIREGVRVCTGDTCMFSQLFGDNEITMDLLELNVDDSNAGHVCIFDYHALIHPSYSCVSCMCHIRNGGECWILYTKLWKVCLMSTRSFKMIG